MLLGMDFPEFGPADYFGRQLEELELDCEGDVFALDPADYLDEDLPETLPSPGAVDAALDFFGDLKSDCMWGSALSGEGRRRDLSVTLADLLDSCAEPAGREGVFGDLPGGSLGDAEGQIFGGRHRLEEQESDDFPKPGSLAKARSSAPSKKSKKVSALVRRNLPHVEPGRSLLLSSHGGVPPGAQGHQTFLDHCYFSPTPVEGRTPGGFLTPNDTSCSEDDETALRSPTKMHSASQGIDKKKIVQAVQSLIKKNPNAKSRPVKFRFRMKFNPGAGPPASYSSQSKTVGDRHVRRTSALLNPHCPAPSQNRSINLKTVKVDSRLQSKEIVRGKTGIKVQNLRDHRDLHNSMERQRRIDLRHNFDILKSAVPDLANNDKASKLNILKQAALYCQKVKKLNTQMSQCVSVEQSRNATLKKKFQLLKSQFHKRRPSARQIKPKRL